MTRGWRLTPCLCEAGLIDLLIIEGGGSVGVVGLDRHCQKADGSILADKEDTHGYVADVSRLLYALSSAQFLMCPVMNLLITTSNGDRIRLQQPANAGHLHAKHPYP